MSNLWLHYKPKKQLILNFLWVCNSFPEKSRMVFRLSYPGTRPSRSFVSIWFSFSASVIQIMAFSASGWGSGTSSPYRTKINK